MRLVFEPSLCKVVLTRLRNKKRPPPLTIVDHKEPGEESSFEQVDHYHLDRQLLLGLGDLRLASLPSPPVVVHERGFLSMALSHGVTVDLTPRQALRVSNPVQASSIAISSCGRQLAFLHPTGWHFPKPRCQLFLTKVFRENARNMDIRDMFDMIAHMMNDKESNDKARRKQTFENIEETNTEPQIYT